MQLTTTTAGNVITVNVDAPTIDAAVAAQFKSDMLDIINASNSADIVLDISGVRMIDSSGLGTLVALLKVLGTERELTLRQPAPSVIGLLKLTRMDRVFRVEQPESA